MNNKVIFSTEDTEHILISSKKEVRPNPVLVHTILSALPRAMQNEILSPSSIKIHRSPLSFRWRTYTPFTVALVLVLIGSRSLLDPFLMNNAAPIPSSSLSESSDTTLDTDVASVDQSIMNIDQDADDVSLYI